VILGLALALGAGAGSSQAGASGRQRSLVELAEVYRAVDRERAVAVVALWDRETVEAETQRLIETQVPDEPAGTHQARLLAAAALLVDSALLDLDVGSSGRTRWELQSAARLVEATSFAPGSVAFAQRFYLVAGLMLHRMADLGSAHEMLSDGLGHVEDDAQLLLALGAVSETIVSLRTYEPPLEARGRRGTGTATHYVIEGQGGGGGPLPRTSLAEVQALYARALARDPDLLEARLRLGRVLLLRGRPGEALPELERVGRESPQPAQCYLARLFEGRAREELDDLRGAAAALEAGVECAPHAQSGLVALGRALDRVGEGTRAQQAFDRALNLDSETQADPWWDYIRGQPDRTDGLLAELRRLVP